MQEIVIAYLFSVRYPNSNIYSYHSLKLIVTISKSMYKIIVFKYNITHSHSYLTKRKQLSIYANCTL